VFGVLGRFDDGRFVEIALVVDVQLAEGVLQAEDFRLLELRIFPAIEGASSANLVSGVRKQNRERNQVATLPLDLDDVHGDFNVEGQVNQAGVSEVVLPQGTRARWI